VWTADALQDVDESFGKDHAAETARWRPPRNSNDLALPERSGAFLRSISERQIAGASTVPAFADESVFGWLASRSLSVVTVIGPPTRRFAAATADSLRLRSRAKAGEPKFCELEPDWQMAQTGGGASRRCLIAVDDASRL
jgi:hypothetical protein